MVKMVFDLYRGKQNLFLGFSSVFALKQAKEQILFQVQPLKMLNTVNIKKIAHFTVG